VVEAVTTINSTKSNTFRVTLKVTANCAKVS